MSSDVIIARVMHFMAESFDSAEERLDSYTIEDAARMRFSSALPLLLEHDASRRCGHIISATMGRRRGYLDVMASIDMHQWPSALEASDGVATGVLPDVSLGHHTEALPCPTTGILLVDKQPRELSIVTRGRRDAPHITHFYPCRATLERLAANGTLVDMARRFDYELTDAPDYIDVLSRTIEQALVRERHRRFPLTMSVNASETTDDVAMDEAPPPPPVEQPTASSPPAPPAPAASPPPPPASDVAGAPVSMSSEEHSWMKKALDAAAKFEELKKTTAEEKAQAEAEKARIAAELAEERKEKEAAAAAAKAKADKMFEDRVKSYVQAALRNPDLLKKSAIDESVEGMEALYKVNPEAGLAQVKNNYDLLVNASKSSEEASRQRQKEVREQMAREDRASTERAARMYHDRMNSTITTSSPPPAPPAQTSTEEKSTMKRRATDMYALADEDAAPAKRTEVPAELLPPPAIAEFMQKTASFVPPTADGPFDSENVERSQDLGIPVRDMIDSYVAATGYFPSEMDLLRGTTYLPSGVVTASADGGTRVVKEKRYVGNQASQELSLFDFMDESRRKHYNECVASMRNSTATEFVACDVIAAEQTASKW